MVDFVNLNQTPAEPEDPWDWSVEQVIDAVCHNKESSLAEEDHWKAFEQKLQENSVRGLTFLKKLRNMILRERSPHRPLHLLLIELCR